MNCHLFRKDFRQCALGEQINPAKQMKEGCLMIIEGIKGLIKSLKVIGFSLNVGFFGLNFAGSSS